MKLRILAAVTWLVSVDTSRNIETIACAAKLFLVMRSSDILICGVRCGEPKKNGSCVRYEVLKPTKDSC